MNQAALGRPLASCFIFGILPRPVKQKGPKEPQLR
jgi:hypothetical protein